VKAASDPDRTSAHPGLDRSDSHFPGPPLDGEAINDSFRLGGQRDLLAAGIRAQGGANQLLLYTKATPGIVAIQPDEQGCAAHNGGDPHGFPRLG
jgi:hypothetical protein